jgi:hypothetical protein
MVEKSEKIMKDPFSSSYNSNSAFVNCFTNNLNSCRKRSWNAFETDKEMIQNSSSSASHLPSMFDDLLEAPTKKVDHDITPYYNHDDVPQSKLELMKTTQKTYQKNKKYRGIPMTSSSALDHRSHPSSFPQNASLELSVVDFMKTHAPIQNDQGDSNLLLAHGSLRAFPDLLLPNTTSHPKEKNCATSSELTGMYETADEEDLLFPRNVSLESSVVDSMTTPVPVSNNQGDHFFSIHCSSQLDYILSTSSAEIHQPMLPTMHLSSTSSSQPICTTEKNDPVENALYNTTFSETNDNTYQPENADDDPHTFDILLQLTESYPRLHQSPWWTVLGEENKH